MKFITKLKFEGLNRFFSKIPGFSQPEKYAIHFLNLAQLMGVINDNIFKLVIAFLIIGIQGPEQASKILSTAGAIFVLPFLLFSSNAGVLADRFSKQRLLRAMKFVEILIMCLAIFAFGFKSIWGSYTLLFLLSTHSALFGPSKYAIISELVPKEKVPRANGLITAFTYLGVVLGTFLASFITEITHRQFVIVACFCLFIAVIGFISTFGIQRTPAQGSEKKLNPFFLREIGRTLGFCYKNKRLFIAVCSSSYFFFIGSFTQLNIIPYGISSLHLSEIAGGYLFLSTSLGIVIGAYLGGRVSKSRVELGLSCISGIAIATLLIFLGIFSTQILSVISILVFLGIFGGLFIVPFDSYVQLFSPPEKRGQIIAANNFLSFSGVLVASFCLYLFGSVLQLKPSSGFILIGILTIFLSLLVFSLLSDLAFAFLARVFVKPFLKITIKNRSLIEENPQALLILQNGNWIKAFLLMEIISSLHFVVEKGKRGFPWFNWTFHSLHVVSSFKNGLYSFFRSHKYKPDIHFCLLPRTKESLDFLNNPHSQASLPLARIIYVDVYFNRRKALISFQSVFD